MADAAPPTGDQSPRSESGSLNTRYLLETVLAGGGMGDVYLGHDTLLDRPVAVKVLRPAGSATAEDEIAFLNEARTAAALKHPHIVEVYDAGIEDNRRFIVMEYVPGETLRSFIAREAPVSETRAAEIVALVADALDVAHRRGIVHGDIKPGNIMLPAEDRPKIVDFGIASVSGVNRGEVAGTPGYVAPEVARGLAADGRADVYSLTVVLRELATGQPAVPPANPATETTLSLPPGAAGGRLIHPQLQAIIERGTAEERDRRFATAGELAQALRAFTIGQSNLRTVIRPVVDREAPLEEPTIVSAAPLAPALVRRRFPWLMMLVLGLIVTLLTAGGVVAATGVLDRGPSLVTVPGVERQRLDAAASALQGAGLRVAAPVRFVASGEPFGNVIGQSPAAGSRIEEGSPIELTVSMGTP